MLSVYQIQDCKVKQRTINKMASFQLKFIHVSQHDLYNFPKVTTLTFPAFRQ